MTARNPSDVRAIQDLIAENVRLSNENHLMAAAYGEAQLRIEYLTRVIDSMRGGGANMRAFQHLRETAIDNGKKGMVP